MPTWTTFFSAELSAAATLTGLLFVAVSINLTRILQFAHLPARAAEALLAIVSVLFVASFGLIPGQSVHALAVEIGITGVVVWILQTVLLARSRKHERQFVALRARFVINQLPPIPFILSGVLLATNHLNGMYWTVPGVLLSLVCGIFEAWILLVEILR